MTALPPVAPSVLADVLDALPPRLRKRVDAALPKAATWQVTIEDNKATTPLDDETSLTWHLTNGVLTSADALVCSCLLAPRCLHRGIAVAAAEITAPPIDDPPTEPSEINPDPEASAPPEAGFEGENGVVAPNHVFTEVERTAAAGLWAAGATVLRAGASGSGTVVRAELLRAVHQARVAGLHRAAASGLRVATALAAARTNDASFDRATLTDDLLDLLLLCHDLRTATTAGSPPPLTTATASHPGTATVQALPADTTAPALLPSTAVHPAPPLGTATATATTTATTTDPASLPDPALLPDTTAPALLPSTAVHPASSLDTAAGSPSPLADPGLLLGTARREYHPVGSLRLYGLCTEAVVADTGYGGVVTHLVDADGLLWTIPAIMPGGAERVSAAANGPVAVGESGLTHRALSRAGLVLSGGTASPDRRLGAGQKVRAVAAKGAAWDEPPAARLWQEPLADQVARVFAALREHDRPAGADLLFLDVEVLGPAGPALRVAADTTELDLTGDTDRTRENLRVLATATGTRLRVIARLLPHLPGTATALAVQATALTLPAAMNGTVDLALDQLQRSHVPAGEPRDLPQRRPPEHQVPLPLHPLRNLVHRIALAGRSVATATSSDRNVRFLTANGLATTAAVLTALATATHTRHRDAFGRAIDDRADDFPRAWLTAALHLRAFTAATAHQTWLR